jgi:hypothetical protein
MIPGVATSPGICPGGCGNRVPISFHVPYCDRCLFEFHVSCGWTQESHSVALGFFPARGLPNGKVVPVDA